MTATRGAATDRPATSKDRPQAALGRTPSRLPTPAVQAAAVRRTADEQSSRGRVTIAKVVIEKLAGQAAAEIPVGIIDLALRRTQGALHQGRTEKDVIQLAG